MKILILGWLMIAIVLISGCTEKTHALKNNKIYKYLCDVPAIYSRVYKELLRAYIEV